MIRDHVSFPPLPLPLLLPYDLYESIGRKSKVERQDSIDGVRTAGGEGEGHRRWIVDWIGGTILLSL